MTIDFRAIDKIFERAEKDGRAFLFEHEVYEMLEFAGIRTPEFKFVPKGAKIERKDLAGFKSAELVLKIIAPLIQHKTDVGGVMFVKNSPAALHAGMKTMLSSVPRRYLIWARKLKNSGSPKTPSLVDIQNDIRGVLICEKIDYDRFGFGAELLVGIHNSREFGPMVTLGAGGVEVEFLNERIQQGKAVSMASPHFLQKKNVLRHLEPLAVYDKLVKPFRGKRPVLPGAELRDSYFHFCELAAHYSPFESNGRYVIEEAEVNPFVVRAGKLVPLDGLCRFSRRHVDVEGRPFAGIKHVLHPESIAVIGVSERMNLGHVILNNILRQEFPRERVYVVKPGLQQIEGCRCVPDIASLPETVDLFVLTLAAEQSYEVMAELISRGKARSVIIVAAGIGEKQGTQGLEERIVNLITASRAQGKLTPVVNGGNCLGVYSKPGRYDTTFTPEYKVKFPKAERSNLVYISQSGAFMLSRVSRLRRLEPLYGISLGNQIDLRVSDYLNYLKDESDIKIFAVYIEGFKPGDGYLFAAAAAQILKKEGRTVIVYKSGRTAEGRLATSSHTASVAGDYGVCRAVLEEAGVIVAGTIFEFENFVKGLSYLGGKKVRGNRVGLISNAGFECVIMSDSLENGERLELAALSEATQKRLAGILAPLGIDRLQDIKNPLDVTPVADDEVFAECARAILEDDDVDCAVISPVPMTQALQTLAPGQGYAESIYHPESTSSRLIEIFRSTEKPFVVNVDAGLEYDPMVDELDKAGIPTFRRSDEAVQFLRKHVAAQLIKK
jgi:acyl-CoA synthetase (NDP forming)